MGRCGYHFFIRHDGTIERGRPEWAVGAHSLTVNARSIGICLAGDFTIYQPSEIQLVSLEWLINSYLLHKYPLINIVGHSDTDSTQCPGILFPLDKFKNITSQLVKLIVNGRLVNVPLRIMDGRTEALLSDNWVQLRELANMLGADISWDELTRTVNMSIK
nr:N-acetylmuramoyl-L-alanine amidase [Desulforamulus aquiferis]